MLSGYSSKLYDDRLRGWRPIEFETRETTSNHQGNSANRCRKRTEVVWMNYEPDDEPSIL